MHRRTTSSVDVRGAAQLPWPRKYGTPPWAVARQLSGSTGTPWQAKAISPWGRSGALKEIRSAAATRAVPVYVGSRWLPRHVVLVLDADLRVYEPSSGRVVTITADDFVERLAVAGRLVEPLVQRAPSRRDSTVRTPGQTREDITRGRNGCGTDPPSRSRTDPGQDRPAASAAYPGLMTSSMIARRSSNGRNADFIALIVNHRRSSKP